LISSRDVVRIAESAGRCVEAIRRRDAIVGVGDGWISVCR
jgi:hypothetical protein